MSPDRQTSNPSFDEHLASGQRPRGWLGRVFGDGEDPLSWGLPLGRVLGVRVRVHLLFVVFVLARLAFTLPQSRGGLVVVGPILAALVAMVVLHELGRWLACRRVGGELDEVMLWPLGGLTRCRVSNNPRAELIAALGGPAANVLVMPFFMAGLVVATGGWSVLSFNPFDPGHALGGLSAGGGAAPMWLAWLWSLYYANALLIGLNLLVPMHPLDAGRVLQVVLARRTGERRSHSLAAMAGLVTAGILAAAALSVVGGTMLVGIAACGGLVCWLELRRQRFLEFASEFGDVSPAVVEAVEEQDQAEQEEEAASSAELDRVLAKISSVGVEGLTASERRLLKRATKHSRDTP